MNLEKIKQEVERITAEANFSLRKDVLKLLKKAYLIEKNKKAKLALGWILDNTEITKKENLAICQDTGLPIIFIKVGKGININFAVLDLIKKSVESAYRKNYLRPSIVDPLKRGQPSYAGAICHLDFSSFKEGLKITIFPKGFGSENKSQLKMFNPTAELKQIEDFIVECAKQAGPAACPPFIIGVGIGGTADKSLLLAKQSLLDDVTKPNLDKDLYKIEKRLVEKINSLRIGPMGLGGNSTCLAVKIKKSPTHIAGLPVGVNISCWALRSASVCINSKSEYRNPKQISDFKKSYEKK
ncbi:MAG: fumarate hydratase [Candidatus Omnitrophota bacterium]